MIFKFYEIGPGRPMINWKQKHTNTMDTRLSNRVVGFYSIT